MRSKQEISIKNNQQVLAAGTEGGDGRRLATVIFRTLIPLAVLAAGVITAFWLMETSPQAKPRPQVHNATLVSVKSVDFSPQQTVISGMGTVTAAHNVELKPQVSGEIIELNRNLVPGGHFRRGETLLTIDPTDYRLTVRQLTTDVAKAESDLQLEQGNQLVAQKEYKLLGETVSDVEKALMLRRPQLENLRATLEAAQAKLEQARVDLARTQIKAPFNAVVQARSADVGARVSESTVLATLVGTDAYWVEVSVSVRQLRWIRIPQTDGDQGALVRVYDSAAWGDGVFRQGRVVRLEADLEEQGRMARLLVRVEDPLSLQPGNTDQPRMLLGSYLRVEIEGQPVTSAAAIDREFIRNGSNVWIMEDNGNLSIRPVEIAFRGIDHILVTGGISPGEKLVVTDLAAPVEGMLLRAADAASDEIAIKQLNHLEDPS